MVEATERKYNGRAAFKLVFPVLVVVFVVMLSIRSQKSLLRDISVVSSPSAPQSRGVKIDGRACRENPYAASFHSSLDSIRSQADTWLENMDSHLQKATQGAEMRNHSHARFFPFEVMAECDSTCVGDVCRNDLSKIICGIEKLQTEEKCVVYSVGGNNQWEFERDILEKTPCEVHTFDCAEYVPYKQGQRCDGGICGDILTLYQIQIMLGHKRIDLFKVDIEGYEWPIFESWPELTDTNQVADMVLPMQILVEIHYRTQMPDLWPPGQTLLRKDFKSAEDLVKLQEHLLKTGYAVAVRDDNQRCEHCTELTLVRYQCQHQSAQQESQQQPREISQA